MTSKHCLLLLLMHCFVLDFVSFSSDLNVHAGFRAPWSKAEAQGEETWLQPRAAGAMQALRTHGHSVRADLRRLLPTEALTRTRHHSDCTEEE